MTGITRPLTSIKTVNTLLITELTCPENWSLIFPSISANLSCLCWSDTNWSWTSARSGINDKLCSEFKQHWQFDRRAIKHDTFSLSLLWCSGSWSDATFLIWFFRSVKYFHFPWRDDMERIDNGISSMWSHTDKRSLQPGTTRYFIFYRSGCGIRVMYIIWEWEEACPQFITNKKTRMFSPVCNLLETRNKPRKQQKLNAKLFGNSSSVPPSWGRSGVINIKTKYLDGDHFGNISLRGLETRVFILDPPSLTNWGNGKDWILISSRRPR